MALQDLLAVPAIAGSGDRERQLRLNRWHFFQVVFVLTYAGVVLDELTTGLGFVKSGASYEQNPLGSLLIGNLGWVGLWLLVTLASVICYFSFRVVYFRMSPAWSLGLNVVVVLVTLVRWLAVVTAIQYLLS